MIATVRDSRASPSVVSPYSASGAHNISRDRRSALVTFELRGDDDQTQAAIGGVVDGVNAAAKRHPGVFVGEFGDASAEAAISDSVDKDFQRAETLSLPLTLLILLFAFGSLIAAGVPLLLGITSVMAALGLVERRQPRLADGRRGVSVVLLSASPSESTTRCSTCAASARSALAAAARARRSRSPRRPRAAP